MKANIDGFIAAAEAAEAAKMAAAEAAAEETAAGLAEQAAAAAAADAEGQEGEEREEAEGEEGEQDFGELREKIDGYLHDLGMDPAAFEFQDVVDIEQQLKIIKTQYKASALNFIFYSLVMGRVQVLPFFFIYSDYHPVCLRVCRGKS